MNRIKCEKIFLIPFTFPSMSINIMQHVHKNTNISLSLIILFLVFTEIRKYYFLYQTNRKYSILQISYSYFLIEFTYRTRYYYCLSGLYVVYCIQF